MKYLGSKVLETDRLILRPTKEEDLKIIWTILCDKKVAEHYLVGKFNYDWEKEKVWQRWARLCWRPAMERVS